MDVGERLILSIDVMPAAAYDPEGWGADGTVDRLGEQSYVVSHGWDRKIGFVHGERSVMITIDWTRVDLDAFAGSRERSRGGCRSIDAPRTPRVRVRSRRLGVDRLVPWSSPACRTGPCGDEPALCRQVARVPVEPGHRRQDGDIDRKAPIELKTGRRPGRTETGQRCRRRADGQGRPPGSPGSQPNTTPAIATNCPTMATVQGTTPTAWVTLGVPDAATTDEWPFHEGLMVTTLKIPRHAHAVPDPVARAGPVR